MAKTIVDWIALVLLVIGGINWGLYGLFKFDLVSGIFGMNIFSTIIYALVGLAGLYGIYFLTKKE